MLLYDCHILNEPTSRLYESLIRPKNYAPRARKHLQDILADFAQRVPKENTVTLRESEVLTNEWVFKEPTDVEFLDAYPEVVQVQNTRWENFQAYLEADRAKIMCPPRPPHVFASVAAQAQELVLPALHKGILNMSEIRSCLKQSNSSELHSLAFLSEPELLGTLGDNVVCIDGACALLSLGDVVIDPLRKILLKLFKVKGRTIKRVDIMKSARAELEVLPSNPAFMRCLRDVCLSRGASWVFRSGIDHHMPA